MNFELHQGKPKYPAILDSAVSRLRPVCMASGTTILGMTPLITDPFLTKSWPPRSPAAWSPATVLTLVVVPLFYKIFFRVKCEENAPSTIELTEEDIEQQGEAPA